MRKIQELLLEMKHPIMAISNKAIVELIEHLSRRIERIENTQSESSACRPMMPTAGSAAVNTPQSPLNQDSDEPPAVIASNLTAAMPDDSVPRPPITPSEQGSIFQGMDRLLAEIEAGKSRRLERESRERIEKLTSSTTTASTSYSKPIGKPKNSE